MTTRIGIARELLQIWTSGMYGDPAIAGCAGAFRDWLAPNCGAAIKSGAGDLDLAKEGKRHRKALV